MELSETVRAESDDAPEPQSDPDPFAIGQIVAGSYRIEGVLGAGGMGIVYEATDLNLPRSVAIKASRPYAPREALRNEAQALAALRHPAFTTVHQFGRHQGLEFFVMERLFGDTLASRLDALRIAGAQLRIPEILDLLIAIADGLSAAHRVGVTHRDLKPSNIIVCGERTVLIDLGLFIPEVLVGPQNLAAGSVYSMAPEVALGVVAKGQGPQIDLYALGALAYELLTGVPPFTADRANEILLKHISAPVPDPREKREDTPEQLAELVIGLLAKAPFDRPSSAEAVVWQLKELRGDTPWRRRPTRVLVVDDDVAIGQGVSRNLEQIFPHLEVRATTDPTAALPRNGRAPADIMVLDVDMPGVNGIEICMALRSLPPPSRPAVVVMSASAGPHDVELLSELGIQNFFPKDESLFRAVGDAIGRLRCGEVCL